MTKDYIALTKQIDLNNRAVYQAAPEAMSGFRAVVEASSKDGALEAKTKELMALCASIALRCEDCIAFHARAAHQKGATREEVAETIAVAVEMGGGPAAVYAGKALNAFDQFAAG